MIPHGIVPAPIAFFLDPITTIKTLSWVEQLPSSPRPCSGFDVDSGRVSPLVLPKTAKLSGQLDL